MMGFEVANRKRAPVTFRGPMLQSSRRVPGLAAVLGPALALGWLAGACASPRPASPAPSPAAPAAPEISQAAPAPDECVFRPAGPAGGDTVRVIAGR